MIVYLILLSILSSATTSQLGLVKSCNDGDTCRIELSNRQVIKVRLNGIDAPESDQPGGDESRQFLEDLIKGKEVSLNCNGQSWDRKTCSISVKGIDVQAEMVKAGWAWDSPKYSEGKYKLFQDQASKSGIGLWSKARISSPYCWRWTGKGNCLEDERFQE